MTCSLQIQQISVPWVWHFYIESTFGGPRTHLRGRASTHGLLDLIANTHTHMHTRRHTHLKVHHGKPRNDVGVEWGWCVLRQKGRNLVSQESWAEGWQEPSVFPSQSNRQVHVTAGASSGTEVCSGVLHHYMKVHFTAEKLKLREHRRLPALPHPSPSWVPHLEALLPGLLQSSSHSDVVIYQHRFLLGLLCALGRQKLSFISVTQKDKTFHTRLVNG